MTNRNKAIDMAKGFSLLTLPAIHSALFYSKPQYLQTAMGTSLAFIAEFLGAPVFMITMGWSVSLGKKKSLKAILFRCLKLLILGYLLNFLKFGVPFLTVGLPGNLFSENNLTNDTNGLLQLLLIGDILQLAAISYLVCGLLLRLKHYGVYAGVSMVLVVSAAPGLWNTGCNDPVFNKPLKLFFGSPPECFFPAFPWLAYPLVGLMISHLQHESKKRGTKIVIALSAVCIALLSAAVISLEPPEWNDNFYRPGPGGAMLHISIAILFINLCDLLSTKMKDTGFFKLLHTLSKNVTSVYMIQWVLVCWCLPVFGYHQLQYYQVNISMVIITCLTIFFSLILEKHNQSWKRSMTSQV